MPRVEFERIDLRISVRRGDDGGALILVEGPGVRRKLVVTAGLVESWLRLKPGRPIPRLPAILSLKEALGDFRPREAEPADQEVWRERLALDIADPDLAALAWEKSIEPALSRRSPVQIVVRVSPVRPRVLSAPLTLPLRILQVDPAPGKLLAGPIRALFGSLPAAEIAEVVQIETRRLREIRDWRAPRDWPTVEVVHFDRLPAPRGGVDPLSTASPDEPGTLGWLSRLTDVWQTRLVVVACRKHQDAAAARRLAAALVARGGPAVLVGAGRHPGFFESFYDNLIHDFPLDDALLWGYGGPVAGPALFVGAGREEALRVSSIGLGLLRMLQDLEPARGAAPGGAELEGLLRRTRGTRVTSAHPLRELRSTLRRLESDWPTYAFEFHEREGLVPLSRIVSTARRTAGVSGPAPARTPPPGPLEPRFVNSSLWREETDRKLHELDPREARLRIGEPCFLGVQIGPRDEVVPTLGGTPILEEWFKWTPDTPGVWVEIGVTGLDFEVIGDPVQELWLPRDGPSDLLHFTIVPRVAGAARLRFCLYHRQNVLQSFRLAALTLGPGRREPGPGTRASRLARALGLKPKDVEGRSYLTRLEYSLGNVADVASVAKRPPRAVSLVANDLDGRPVITVKGPDVFSVSTDQDLPDAVTAIRTALREIATPPIPGVDPSLWVYGFRQPGGSPNAGSPAILESALRRLAEAGWGLYSKILPRRERERLAPVLGPERQTIHVAHVLLEKVIPWSVLYDERYDAGRQEDEQGRRPIRHTACLAALPRADGTLPATACGALPECLLHRDQIASREAAGGPWLERDTVACPLHFWGFKHILEIPPQQVEPGASEKRIWDQILADGPARLAAGIHARLDLASEHSSELDQLAARPSAPAVWTSKVSRRDAFIKKLKDLDLDLIYLYCHARGGLADPAIKPPYLELQDETDAVPGKIHPSALDHDEPWRHHPLVFLNGCGTVAFSPDALSPFIVTLVRDREASAVIGTEIPVWEQLASAVAVEFLGRFLAGRPAGEVLLEVRRGLLSRHNPLGLVYTLYGTAELALVRRALPVGSRRQDGTDQPLAEARQGQ